jgi:hypothetical protein
LIYNAFHGWNGSIRHFRGSDFERYNNSMALIDDSGSAVWSHMREGFSRDPMRAYIEFWGVMQAIVIQQEAIWQLHEAVVGAPPAIPSESAWKMLRKMRDLCAGHPAHRGHGVPAPQRTYMGRHFGDYDCIRFRLYDEHTDERTVPNFNLRKMILDYDMEASGILTNVLTKMRQLAADENASTNRN